MIASQDGQLNIWHDVLNQIWNQLRLQPPFRWILPLFFSPLQVTEGNLGAHLAQKQQQSGVCYHMGTSVTHHNDQFLIIKSGQVGVKCWIIPLNRPQFAVRLWNAKYSASASPITLQASVDLISTEVDLTAKVSPPVHPQISGWGCSLQKVIECLALDLSPGYQRGFQRRQQHAQPSDSPSTSQHSTFKQYR